MKPIAKIDAHHHLWTVASPNHPVMRAPGAERFYGHTDGLKVDFGPLEYRALAERQSVRKSVYVETHFVPPEDETAAVQAIADAHGGFPHGVMGRADLASPSLAADLDVHMRSANFRGLRLSLNWSPIVERSSAPRDGLLRDPDWRRGYGLLGRRGLVADLMIWPQQMADAAALADAFPDVQMVINHAGLPIDLDRGGLPAWRDGMARLAQRPQVAVKISGLGMVDHGWTRDSIAPVVDEIIGLFGPDRCMFASNFPVDGLHATFDAVFDAFDDITARRPAHERARLFHDTAERIYRLA